MSSLYICVCLDFLMALGDFFVKGLPPSPEVTPPPVTAVREEVQSKCKIFYFGSSLTFSSFSIVLMQCDCFMAPIFFKTDKRF